MKLSEISIRRPVLATVLNLVIVLMGLVAWDRLPLREYPNIDVPTISVETTWRGASAEIMETQVTKILEDSISGIEGVDYISSTTRAEASNINIVFKLDRNADTSAADVRDRVGRVRSMLPDDVDEPVIAKTQADATPIIYLALSSDSISELELTDIADRVVQDRLQTVPGVASAEIFGSRRYAMRIWINSQRLAAYQLTPEDINQALLSQNIEVPGGRIEDIEREFTVLTETDLRTPEQFSKIIVKQGEGSLVRLADVARVELAAADTRVGARHNNKPSVAIGIVKQSTANPLEVSQGITKAIESINRLIPAGVTLSTAYDSTIFIKASLHSVYTTIGEAIVCVALVILFFMRSFRASIIPLITIPVSLLGGLILMMALGFSLNTLTLLAFVLAIGLVVDDAIVMLENIARYIDLGMTPVEAAFKGSKEIGFAVIAMTLTLAAVYAPIAMAEGRTGKLFTEFALALAGAVVVSGFIALTLTPMLSSVLLRHGATGHSDHEPFYIAPYRKWLLRALEHRRLIFSLAGLTLFVSLTLTVGLAGIINTVTGNVFAERIGKLQQLVGGVVLMQSGKLQGPPPADVMAMMEAEPWYFIPLMITAKPLNVLIAGLPQELSPVEDRGYLIGVAFSPEGSTIDYTNRYAHQIEQIYSSVAEREMHFVVTGFPVVTQMVSFLALKDWSERDRSTGDIATTIGGPMFAIPGVMAFAFEPPSLGQDFLNTPVSFVVQTSGNWADLGKAVDELMSRARLNPGLMNLRSDLELNKPELRLTLNRDKVADVGADVAGVGRTLEIMMGGRQVTRFKKDGEQYDVIVQADDAQRRQPSDLTGVFVRTTRGDMIQLSNLVTVNETVTPKELNHFSKLRSATITATIAPGYSLGQALSFLDTTLKQSSIKDISADYNGNSREFVSSSSSILFVFALALIFIYLVLAAQFESFIDPLVIMIAVPLAMFGALIALWATGNTINIYSQIGLITLVGLIAKNGILIVEFANQLQEQGRNKFDAVVEASQLRLRPILMTSIATVFGALPLAFAHGAGAEARGTIGWVIVGGMTIGTFFTLFVIPGLYVVVAQKKVAQEV